MNVCRCVNICLSFYGIVAVFNHVFFTYSTNYIFKCGKYKRRQEKVNKSKVNSLNL